MIRLVDYDIPAGTKSNMGKGDDWPRILEKILASDIIVFATPIWWGIQSSLMQRVIERLDELHNEILETGKSRLTNKVGGIVITGEEDGEQHITGNIANFLLNMGVTLPPHCSLSYQGSYTRATRSEGAEIRDSLSAGTSVPNAPSVPVRRSMADPSLVYSRAIPTPRNLAFFARLLTENNIPAS